MLKNVLWLITCVLLVGLDINSAISNHANGETGWMIANIILAAILGVCGLFYLAAIILGL